MKNLTADMFNIDGTVKELDQVQPVTVTVNNVTKLDPTTLYVSLAHLYGKLRLPGEVASIEDMQQMAKLISYCANAKMYLNSLAVYLDIATRTEKRKGKEAKTAYDVMVCRKGIVNSYLDMLESLSKAGSRMVTIFLEAKRASEEDGYAIRKR